MALALSHKVRNNYLEITTSGKRTPGNEKDELTQIWKEVFVLADRHGHTAILAHIREEGQWPLNAQINFSIKMEETGVRQNYRVAGICYTQELFNDHELFIKYGRAMGFDIQIFREYKTALDWLINAKPGMPKIHDIANKR